MITNLLSSTAGDTTSTPLIAKTGQFLPHPIEANNTSPLPADIPPNIQKNVNPPMPLTNQSNLYLGPRAPLAQMNVIPFRQNPSVLPRPNISMYSPLASRPPSLPKTNPPRGVPRPPRPPQSQMPPRTAPIQKPPNSSESMTSQTQSKHQPISAPLRYELTNDPFPNWKKEVLIPGWTSQTEWIGKPQIQFTPPGSSIPLLSKQAVKAYVLAREEFKSIHHLINAFDFREVFCLCHKPEISEVITYMECMANVAGCNRWFHPECAGWDRFELDQYEIDIICPLCTEYMEQNPAVNSLIERRYFLRVFTPFHKIIRLYLNFLKNKMNPESIYSDPARFYSLESIVNSCSQVVPSHEIKRQRQVLSD